MDTTTSWLTVEEVAGTLRVSTRTVRKWIQRGELSAVKAGKNWIVSNDALQHYLDQHRNT